VRHQATRMPGTPTPFQLWRAANGRLDLYQQIQRRPVLRCAAAFGASPLNETLFVRIYDVNGLGTAAPGLIDAESLLTRGRVCQLVPLIFWWTPDECV
jgi:hypothetical protein